jgi:hypothetical protein
LRTLAQGDARVLAGQISALCDVRLQQWVRIESLPHALDHCRTHIETLVERVHAGALLLCDRGSFRFAFCDQLLSRGIWWTSRYAHQASSQVSHICSQADGILDAVISLGADRDTQARYPVAWSHAGSMVGTLAL